MEERFYFTDSTITIPVLSVALQNWMRFLFIYFFFATATLIFGTVITGNTSRHRNISTRILQTGFSVIFIVTPCINDIKQFIVQLMHTTLKKRTIIKAF